MASVLINFFTFVSEVGFFFNTSLAHLYFVLSALSDLTLVHICCKISQSVFVNLFIYGKSHRLFLESQRPQVVKGGSVWKVAAHLLTEEIHLASQNEQTGRASTNPQSRSNCQGQIEQGRKWL